MLNLFGTKEREIMTYSQQMIAALQNEMTDEYPALFELALENDPIDELYRLADTLYGLGFYNDLERLIYRLLESNPTNDTLNVRLADIIMDKGEDEQAFSILFEIDETSEAYAESLLLQADLYQQQGFPEVSENKLLEARQITDNNPVVEFALMELYFYLQRYNEAIPGYEHLIESGYETLAGTDILHRMGTAYLEMGEYENAVIYLDRSLDQLESLDAYHQKGLALMGQESFDLAIDTFKKALDFDPTYSTIYPALADAYLRNHDVKAALETVENGIEMDSLNPQLYHQGADYARQLKDFDLAKEYYEKSLQLDPEQVAVRLDYVDLLLDFEDYEGVIASIDEATEEEVNDPRFVWAKARAYDALEAFEEAADHYDRASQFLQANPNFLQDYINFLVEDGQRDKAIESINSYLAINPANEDILTLKLNLENDNN